LGNYQNWGIARRRILMRGLGSLWSGIGGIIINNLLVVN
jgi:hypothetical protein